MGQKTRVALVPGEVPTFGFSCPLAQRYRESLIRGDARVLALYGFAHDN